MKLNTIKKTGICLSMLATTISCTSDFEKINTNPNNVTQVELQQDFNNIKSLFVPIYNNIFILTAWPYQIQQNLQGDIWSGYLATPTIFEGGSNNTTYNFIDSWNLQAWDTAYLTVMSAVGKIEKETKGKYNQFYAISLIMKVEAMHRVTDIYGPIVYSNYGKVNPEYDSQQQVYTQMFSELDFAVAELTKRIDAGEATSFNKGSDLSNYNGDYTKWVKFANSLRLRLAMRIVKVAPALAKTEAEKAVSHKIGVMTAVEDTFVVNTPNYSNPVTAISQGWGNISMSADIESIMGGYEDPRLGAFFTKSTRYNSNGEYIGVRTGINIINDSDHANLSKVDIDKTIWMTAAESYFLRAEGVLRGWNMKGTAQDLYEAGIKASFDQHGVSGAATYTADNVKTAKNYVDPADATNNGIAVNNVTVAWDGAATNEVKLQKIITQKWIANFPEGQEAWSEFRRTGYPKKFDVLKNTSGGVIDSHLGVRRVNFVTSERNANPGGVASGVAKLGGPDNGATRLWWDVNAPNF
ncbi:RagB/SusD family nutrient uptake outer membrane protein [Flavobacterium sp. Fl-318]|uniref:RagB/SusD family nutrient uptake outer membrane protein n=1 Tax=Flavobacterium cupriresistens TaxID=2893885 RepID=A0ABU4R6G1_9FLAO|nr:MULTISPECIES: RagB/SusD family nutrient uptake outer membrane protein [unclassified Flavobacterium]MDX6188180.1 RagB/SusD family nutrient uptake outer membrane protein [Flavobacterium sp. Fl-318]UFH41900.1 SusD/RagB family nutrient-binding outer membrane lipoprotein [Flavobacterium sp. F-323]